MYITVSYHTFYGRGRAWKLVRTPYDGKHSNYACEKKRSTDVSRCITGRQLLTSTSNKGLTNDPPAASMSGASTSGTQNYKPPSPTVSTSTA